MPASAALGDRFSLGLQREVGRLLAILWVPLCVAAMRFGQATNIGDGVVQYLALRCAARIVFI